MKQIEWTCDICHKPITPNLREIPINGVLTKSYNPSFMRMTIQQVGWKNNYPERTTEIDLCDEHYKMIEELLKVNYVNEEEFEED